MSALLIFDYLGCGYKMEWPEMVEMLDQCLFFHFLLVLIISVFQKEDNF